MQRKPRRSGYSPGKRRVTIDRLLVLLLSLSFLLLAPPAAAYEVAQPAAPAPLSLQTEPDQTPDPVPLPDDTGLFLLTTAPEAPAPAGTDDSGGHDGLALPTTADLPVRLHADRDTSPVESAVNGHSRTRPWSTGPPLA